LDHCELSKQFPAGLEIIFWLAPVKFSGQIYLRSDKKQILSGQMSKYEASTFSELLLWSSSYSVQKVRNTQHNHNVQ